MVTIFSEEIDRCLKRGGGTEAGPEGGTGKERVLIFSCLSQLTIDHASLFLIEVPPTFGRSLRSVHMVHTYIYFAYLIILFHRNSLSRVTVVIWP